MPVLYGETKQEKKPRAGSLKASGVQAWLSAAVLERQAMHGQAQRASAQGWMSAVRLGAKRIVDCHAVSDSPVSA